MKQILNDFINSVDTKLYSRIRASKGDAECRRYLKEHLQKQLTIPVVSGSTCFVKNSFALVEHKNNDTDEKEYGEVVGETQDYFLVKPHLRKEQNRWLKVDCKIIEYYR